MSSGLINKIKKLKESKSLYEIALDIGISEYSLYCYFNRYNKVGSRVKNKIEKYFKERRVHEN